MNFRGCKLQVSMLLSLTALLVQHELASGQLIGNRTLGAPATSLSQQRGTSAITSATSSPSVGIGLASAGGIGQAANAIGSLGNRLQVDSTRFVRGNRSRQDFVGSNRSDLTGFVGSGQAIGIGRVPSAVENLRIETTTTKINRPLPPQPTKGMYYPRLELDFETMPRQVSPDVSDRVAQFSGGNARVTMTGSTAILRGQVDTIRTSELLVQLLSFEPGIDRVKNELLVK